MITDIIVLIIALFLLVLSSNIFVSSSSRIAKHLGVSEMVIGLTLVAIGTSIPELSSAIAASIFHESSLVIGNIVGANVANIALIFGISLFLVVYINNKETLKELKFLFLVYILFFIFCLDLKISNFEGLILLLGFIYYLYDVFRRKKKPEEYLEKHVKVHGIKKETLFNSIKYYLFFVFSLVVLIFSAKHFVISAINIANYLDVSTKIIGVLMAIGTTFPELSVTIQAARKKFRGILVGDLVGSCIINVLLIIGVASSINEIMLNNLVLYFEIPILVLIAFLMYIFFLKKIRYQKALAYSLIGIYILFLILEFILI